MNRSVDVIVVGMGPAGEMVAGELADAGLEVVGVDARLVGGECPYWGCVPSKMMIRAADLLAEARRIPNMAGEVAVRPSWAPVASRIRDEATDDWDDTAAVERFEGKGGRFVRGEGRIVGPDAVEVGGDTHTASRGIVIATGTRPAVPPIDGLADTPYWTNREAIEVTALPWSLAVLGGGAIGAELAQVFARFGVGVSVVEAEDRLVPAAEPEAAALLADAFAADGIGVHTGAAVSSVRHGDDGFVLEIGDTSLEAEQLLVATGRRTDLEALGVDAAGLDADARFVSTDEHMRAGDGLWAVGDVTGQGAFTHLGIYQARIAVADILGREHPPASYHAVPHVTFTDPEVGAVGLTEAGAREQGIDVAVGTNDGSARGWIHGGDTPELVKLVADASAGVLVGATAVGPHGGEVLGLLALAVHARVPVAELETMIWAYPTFHRIIEGAVADLDL